jgi:hypothetical protein|tara:strand:+ start:361 stop:657 length:297 start_codon:yes stop_codon:yes gene_type:complete
MIEEIDPIFKKCRDVKKQIEENNYKFTISSVDLPDIPESASEELVEFIAENFKFICLTDKRDLLSYMLFVLDEESFEDLVGELTSVEGVDINELFPYC